MHGLRRALYGIPARAARERIKQFKLLGAYSKGRRRKVVNTAALLHNPPVVLFDEPLEGLDANAAVGFKTLIQTLAREGKTIVYSSHILAVVGSHRPHHRSPSRAVVQSYMLKVTWSSIE